jgi:hypothetical protein
MFRPLIVATFREVFCSVYNTINLYLYVHLFVVSHNESTEHGHESFRVATRFFLRCESDQNVNLITNLYQVMKLKVTVSTSTFLYCKVH